MCRFRSIFGSLFGFFVNLFFNGVSYWDADKDRELGEAHAEIKALRLSERQREKAVEEVCLKLWIIFLVSISLKEFILYKSWLSLCSLEL